MGTFQHAHVAKTIVFTGFLVDFRGVAFAPQKWAKWSRRSTKMASECPVMVQIVSTKQEPTTIEWRLQTYHVDTNTQVGDRKHLACIELAFGLLLVGFQLTVNLPFAY